jgi:16S rRNA (cytosine1407-C5)-methyltransferase
MSPADSHELPAAFVERLRDILPEPYFEGCIRAFAEVRPTAFRVNELKTDASSLLAELELDGFTPKPISSKAEAFEVPQTQRDRLTRAAACTEGRLYIQNPSSMIPPIALDPKDDEWILDLTAAPGGKTVQLAGMMGNRGQISAVESVRSRFFRLKRVLDQYGVENTRTFLKDGARVWHSCPEQFDRVLLDAPCTAEGRFELRDPRSYAYWSTKKISEMKRKQVRLIYSAIQSLKPGGVLVYSTCTFAPEENEFIIDGALRRFEGALRVEPLPPEALPDKASNSARGLLQWKGKTLHPDIDNCTRILPDGIMEGFFIARLRKLSSTAG